MLNPTPKTWLSQYYFFYFFSYGVYMPFWAIWLKGIGTSTPDIGLLLGLGFAARCLSNLIIPPRISTISRLIPSLRKISALTLVFFFFYFLASHSFMVLVAVTILFNLMLGPGVPISDTLANYYTKINIIDYGRTRSWGSIAFIVGTVVVGKVIDMIGYISIPYVALIGLVAALLVILRQPNILPQDDENEVNTANKIALLPLLKNKQVLWFIVLTALIQGSHAGYYNFSSLYWADAGYSKSSISILWSIGVLGEIGIFTFGKNLFAKWSINSLMRLSAIGVMVRWSLLAITTDPIIMGWVQLLHGITFAAMHLAAIAYIQGAASKYMVSLQALYNAISMSAFLAVMSALCGVIYNIDPTYVFWLMASMGVPALFIKLEKLKLK